MLYAAIFAVKKQIRSYEPMFAGQFPICVLAADWSIFDLYYFNYNGVRCLSQAVSNFEEIGAETSYGENGGCESATHFALLFPGRPQVFYISAHAITIFLQIKKYHESPIFG